MELLWRGPQQFRDLGGGMGFKPEHGVANALGLSERDRQGGGGEKFPGHSFLIQRALACAAVDADVPEEAAAVLEGDPPPEK